MSRLTVYANTDAATPILRTEDPAVIAGTLKPLGVRFERWDSPVLLPDDAPPEAILDAFRPFLDGLMGENGAGTADVISLAPDNPNGAALRQKFLPEHSHTEDEVRFFVRGSGSFVLHVDGKVHDVFCTQGDLISVPAGINHWFDAGPAPSFTALRVFQDTTGWTPHYTGNDISERFPVA